MADPSVAPPTPRQALIARSEQVTVVVLIVLLLAGVTYRIVADWESEPIEVVPPSDGPTFRINVNTADSGTISMVPGVGPTLARRIIEVRDARPDRRFHSLDELTEVHGIGEKILAKLRPYLVIDNLPGSEPVQMPPAASP
jgi:competence ComEA-like helix-hairpin-helix protein